jgi:glycosyltransferase involved in cell wall biosynthesis
MDRTSTKICFVAMNIYPCLAGKYGQETIGGAEVQQVFIGKSLQEKGIDVAYVTKDFGQKEIEEIDGMKVYKTYRTGSGLPGTTFFYPYMYSIWRSMKAADADIYYTRCAGGLVGIVAMFCKNHKKKMIFAGAHDNDFTLDLPMMTHRIKKMMYRWGLRQADRVIVQSSHQRKLLNLNYQKQGVLIRNFSIHDEKTIPAEDKNIILWVSTLRKWKRPDWFLALSQKFPNEKFVMIGGAQPNEMYYFEQAKRAAKNTKNLDFLGFQPLDVTETYFDRCKVFINTSEKEGFPNTFLQAWRRGIPVLSSVDPDNVIVENKLGKRAESIDIFEKELKNILKESISYSKIVMKYYQQKHSKTNIDKFQQLISEISF